MLNQISKILVFVLIILSIGFCNDKRKSQQKTGADLPNFYYDTFTYPKESRDSVIVEVLIKMPFDEVQFLKEDDTFVGKYEISISILDEESKLVASKIWMQELKTKSFAETNSKDHFDVNRAKYLMLPGKYTLNIGVLDLDTKKSNYKKKIINIDDYYKKSISLSKINIIDKIIKDSTGKTEVLPSVMNTISEEKPEFLIFFTALSEGGSGLVEYKILDMKKKELISDSYKKEFKKGLTEITLTISKKKLSFEEYFLKVNITIGDETISQLKKFKVRWMGMNILIDNLDEAINQLKYIASSKEIRIIRKAKDKEKKEKFQEFWEKRDPTPNTSVNELMNEYYRRVHYSNKKFTSYQPGWRTDMGMVYILFGPPDDLERHPFEINTKPYEIWYYHSISRSFIFMDETGFGDYRLASPLYDYGSNY